MEARRTRKNPRLPGFDYSSSGPYFVTLCTQHRAHLFGKIADHEMHESDAGSMVRDIWRTIPTMHPTVLLDAFAVMPNHIHGLVTFERESDRPVKLGDVIGWFKTITTNHYIRNVAASGWPQFESRVWQRNYYEHVVRNDADLDRIRTYIETNPVTW